MDIIRIIQRRRTGILLVIGISFTLALLGYYLQTPEYHAETIIMINDSQEHKDLLSKVLGPASGIGDNKSVKKDAELIRTMPIAELTIKELEKNSLKGRLELFGNRPYYSPLASLIKPVLPLFASQNQKAGANTDEESRRIALRLNRRISVEPVRETNMMKVSVASPFADEAVLLSNTLCKVYREADIGRNSEKYAQANRFIAEMLNEQQQKVAEADGALSKYMSNHEIYEVTGNTQQLLEKLIEADARYNDIMAEYNITKNNLNFLDQKLTEADKALSSKIAKTVTEQLGSIMDEIRSSENEYVQIVKEKGADSPEAKARLQKLDVVKARYDQLSRSKIAGQIGYAGRAQKYSFDMVSDKIQIERKLNELFFSAHEHNRLKQYYENQLSSLPKKEQDYVRLQRDREAVSKTYVFLKEKLDETRILLGSEVGSVSIVGAAFQPIEPEKPDLKKTLLVGLLCGGFFAVLYTIGTESLDDTIKDVSFFRHHRLGRVFMIPFLGESEVNASADKKKRASRISFGSGEEGQESGETGSVLQETTPKISEQPTSAFAESFRTLRAQLAYLSDSHSSQAILISGTSAEEGKSTVCANLGLAFAASGRKTLIVDCDMMHATQHRIFDCERAPGLSDILLGQEKMVDQRFIQPTGNTNLFVIGSGQEVVNTSELLGSARMVGLIDELKGRFDTILIDSPALFLSDSVQLAQMVDGILLVSRLGYTCKKPILDLVMDEFFSPRILGMAVIDSSGSAIKVPNRYQPLS
ncbi:MAG: AAA family ATPase [Chlorobiaceae bacterium]|nr:AAA family ATPase [Chlorobiaceae bacterium]